MVLVISKNASSTASNAMLDSTDSKVYIQSFVSPDTFLYVQRVILLASIISLFLFPWIPIGYLKIFGLISIMSEVLLQAYNLISKEQVLCKYSIPKYAAFTAALLLTASSLVPLNKYNDLDVSNLVTALGICVFSFSCSDMFAFRKCNVLTVGFNIFYGLCLASGLLLHYLGYPYMGIVTVICMVVKVVETFFRGDEEKLGSWEVITSLAVGLSVLIGLYVCYVWNVDMKLPILSFLKAQDPEAHVD